MEPSDRWCSGSGCPSRRARALERGGPRTYDGLSGSYALGLLRRANTKPKSTNIRTNGCRNVKLFNVPLPPQPLRNAKGDAARVLIFRTSFVFSFELAKSAMFSVLINRTLLSVKSGP